MNIFVFCNLNGNFKFELILKNKNQIIFPIQKNTELKPKYQLCPRTFGISCDLGNIATIKLV